MKNLLIYPSATTWITPRSEDVQLTTNNMLLIMPKPIANLEKVYFNLESDSHIDATVIYTDSSGSLISVSGVEVPTQISTTQSDDGLVKVLDMSRYFVEIAEYKTLNTLTQGELDKRNTNYYARNTTNIKLCTQTVEWTTASPLARSLWFALDDLSKATQLYYKLGSTWTPIQSITINTSAAFNFMKWEFRVHFTPLGETTRLNTLKTHPEKVPFSIPFSQQQQIVSSVGLGRNMQSAADRTGAETRQVVRRVRSVAQLRKIGTQCVENGVIWRLTDIAFTATNSRIIATETWSKNWSVRSQFVGVNREFRSWNIPSDITQRNLLWQDYALLSNKTPLTPTKEALISTEARDVLAKLANGGYSPGREISNMWIYTGTGGIYTGAVCAVSAFGFGNSLVFSAKTKDNLSVGVQRIKLDDNDNNKTQCRDVYYCNSDGTLTSAYITMAVGFDVGHFDNMAYPYSQEVTSDVTLDKNTVAGLVLFNKKQFTINKDPAEQINFTYQLHMVTDDPELLIGTAWAAKNALVTNTPPTSRKYWVLTKKLPQGAQTMSTYYGRQLESNTIVQAPPTYTGIVFKSQSAADVVGMCVTDNDNNIIVAYNRNRQRTFYFTFTHDYNQIAGG